MFFFGNYKIWFHVSSSSPEPFFSLQRSGEPKHKKVCNRIDGRQRYEKFWNACHDFRWRRRCFLPMKKCGLLPAGSKLKNHSVLRKYINIHLLWTLRMATILVTFCNHLKQFHSVIISGECCRFLSLRSTVHIWISISFKRSLTWFKNPWTSLIWFSKKWEHFIYSKKSLC